MRDGPRTDPEKNDNIIEQTYNLFKNLYENKQDTRS